MSSYQSSAFSHVYNYLVIPIIVSIVYWLTSGGVSTKERFFISSHGVFFVLASLFAVFISKYTGRDNDNIASAIFLLTLLAGLISILYSFINYPSSKLVHFIQIPNFICALFIFFIGAMTISHDWL